MRFRGGLTVTAAGAGVPVSLKGGPSLDDDRVDTDLVDMALKPNVTGRVRIQYSMIMSVQMCVALYDRYKREYE